MGLISLRAAAFFLGLYVLAAVVLVRSGILIWI
jgi:hypothetical protein